MLVPIKLEFGHSGWQTVPEGMPALLRIPVTSSKVFPSLVVEWKKSWNQQILEVGFVRPLTPTIPQLCQGHPCPSPQVPPPHSFKPPRDGDSNVGTVGCLCHLIATSFRASHQAAALTATTSCILNLFPALELGTRSL